MATVHQNGSLVHPCGACAVMDGGFRLAGKDPLPGHLSALDRFLAGRGYADGVRREVLAHALAFDGLGGWADELLMPADLADARACLATNAGNTEAVTTMGSVSGKDAPADPFPFGPDYEDLEWDYQYHVQLEESPAPRNLAEAVDHEAIAYRAQGTELGDFLAGQMDRLAQLVRFTGAESVAQFLDRFEALEASAREQHYERGYHDGQAGTFSIV